MFWKSKKEKMMEFKFEIGQTVKHICTDSWGADKPEEIKWGGIGDVEQRFFIIERHTLECPGGVQKHYTCRGVTRKGSVTKEYFRFNEVELILIESSSARK